jgi:hemolysin D
VLMQVVPSESLIARVQVANKDIGTLREGMPVEIRVDAFPFTEFGSIQGVVNRVGSDAIPVDRAGQETVFPVEVKLEQQFLEKQGVRHVLTPGMAVTANIKVESRPPIAFVFGEIVKAFDGLRSAR